MSDILNQSWTGFGNRNKESFKGGQLNVCREDDLGNTSNGWLYNVYLALLLFFIFDHPFGEDHIL
jgi:hypothetical protein